jgi:hypothetical protein
MKLATILEEIWGYHRCATTEDIRKIFGDYHNVLRWLAIFLIEDEKFADAYIVDACSIAETQTPDFHEWLVHWAARATVKWALQAQRDGISELAPKYEHREPVHLTHLPLCPQHFVSLIKNSEDIHTRLDVLCRFVLVLRGIGKDSYDEVATQLGISRSAVEGAYCVAYDAIELTFDAAPRSAEVPASHVDNEHTLADSTA